jgi:hypothetical protein
MFDLEFENEQYLQYETRIAGRWSLLPQRQNLPPNIASREMHLRFPMEQRASLFVNRWLSNTDRRSRNEHPALG